MKKTILTVLTILSMTIIGCNNVESQANTDSYYSSYDNNRPKLISKGGISVVLENSNTYELDLLAQVVMAEVGGNHCEYCERLVIDTVLNRVEDNRFANTISEVVLDSVAFETVKNGSIWKVTPSNEIYKLIIDELVHRTCSDVLAFQQYKYHDFGYAVTNCHEAYYSGIN